MVYKRAAIRSFIAGFRDALWPGAFIYVVTSPLIRRRFCQCCILNGVIFLGSICILNYIIIPLFVFILQFFGFSSHSTEWAQFAVDKLYKAIWVLPLYIFSFVVNSLWYQDIAEQAHLLYSYSRHEEEKSMKKLLYRVKEIKRSKSTSNSPTSNSPKTREREDSFSFSSPTLNDEMVIHNMRSTKNGFYHYDTNTNNDIDKLPKYLKSRRKSNRNYYKNGKKHSHLSSSTKASSSSSNIFNSIKNTINEEIYHCLFLIVFNIQILLFSKMGTIFSFIAISFKYNIISLIFDYIGSLIAFFLFCWQHAFLSFEYKWIMEGKELKYRIKYFEERVAYFSGFGAPLTLMVLIAPHFISTGIYALTFPLFIIQAIESHPIYKTNNESLAIIGNNKNIYKPLRIPVFATTKWIQYIIIWFCGNHFCCIRAVLYFLKKCGKLFGI